MGFASMVEEYSGVTLDKSESRTDWLARPLTERQCEYAAADVWYLLPITAKLMVETEASGWLPAALDECRLMQMRRQEVVAPEDARRDITNARQLRTRQLACLQLLADWRLRKARERDLAVNFVVREEHLWSVARYMPGSLGELTARVYPVAKSAFTVKRCWRWWKKRRHCRKRPYRSRCLT